MKKFVANILLITLLLACEQPFKAGLGPVVDVRPPTVKLESPSAGDYIFGTVTFQGTAEDDYKLDSVWIKVTNQPDVEYLREYTKTSLSDKGEWSIDIDTMQFPDGDLKVQIKAVDSVNKTAETDEVAFFIKNSPPAITVASPFIPRGTHDGNAGGSHLNFGVVDAATLPNSILFTRQLDKGSFLAGTISDDEDIYIGREDPENGRFPPQIRLWRVKSNDGDGEDNPDFASPSWLPGEYPGEEELPWQSFVVNESLFMLGIGNYQFTWDLPHEGSAYYAFEVRAQNKDGRTMFHFPRDCWHDPAINWDDESDPFVRENRFVLLYLRSPKEYPTLGIWGLEDIFGEQDIAGGFTGYGPIYADGARIDDNQAHPYINSYSVNKDGSFTLRVKASHSEGIGHTEVYWEKDDRSERGRFIWDPADGSPKSPGTGNTPSWWAPTNNVAEGGAAEYSLWGYRDQFSYIDGFYNTRNFIFTYNHGGDNAIPDSAQYHSQVRGRSKIQRYILDDDSWKSGKTSGSWPLATVYDSSRWQEIPALSEGVYHIEVYTRSAYGTAIQTPFTCSVRLDWGVPEVEITAIEGAYELNLPSSGTVNGVIRPRLRFSDSRAVDSGIRSATDDYFLNPAASLHGYEERYVLVDQAGRDIFNNKINDKKWWPALPDSALDEQPVLDGVTYYKHGPIFESNFLMKTSPIYNNLGDDPGDYAAEPDALPDGKYWLFVFARDSAFNVGCSEPLEITVDHATDKPVFEFISVDPGVVQPGPEYDWGQPNGGERRGFLISGEGGQPAARNVFGPNTSIRVRIKDDDSLDLGFAADGVENESKVRISFSGIAAQGTDPFAADSLNIILDDGTIKSLFAPQGPDSQNRRRAVKERVGDIKQDVLLPLLKGRMDTVPAYAELFAGDRDYTSLPDGIYRISIEISDYGPAKLKMGDSEPDALVATNSATFWFAVDTVNPEVEVASPSDASYIQPETSTGLVNITGTVSDRNGPIRVREFYVTYPDGGQMPLSKAEPQEVTFTNISTGPLWQDSFVAPVKMILGDDESGRFVITLVLVDRFGNAATVTRNLSVDREKPSVDFRRRIDTFERDADDVTLIGGGSGDNENKTRLANGVLRFDIVATDDFKVEAVRWLLIQADASGNVTTNGYPSPLLPVNDFETHDYVGTANVIAGDKTLTGNDINIPQYIDTRPGTGFADGQYELHLIAIDSAGNVSEPCVQTVFVLQAEDAPYFGAITPSDVAGNTQSDLTIRGTVYDDDGFLDAVGGSGILADSIRVWIGTTVPLNVDDPLSSGFTVVQVPPGSLTRQGKNIGLNIPLPTGDPMFQNNSDGTKYFVIQATDSHFSKFDENGAFPAPAADRRTRSKLYRFSLDTKPPVVNLTAPVPLTPGGEITFGATFNSLLTGSISDVNLRKLDNGNYYFNYRINDSAEKVFDLGPYVTSVSPIDNGENEAVVYFTIPEARVADMFIEAGLPFGDLGEGYHTLMLIAQDRSGKEGIFPLAFIKDDVPPSFSFINIDEVKMPDDWWTAYQPAAMNDTYNQARREWLDNPANALSIVQYSSNVPAITGSFTDLVSDIQPGTFLVWFDGNIGPYSIAFDAGSSGKNVRWTVYLTNGAGGGTASGNILPDGLHTMRFQVRDSANNLLESEMYGFRINSKQPRAKITPLPDNDVFGEVGGNNTVFAVSGTAESPNLKNVRFVIRQGSTTVYSGAIPDPHVTSSWNASGLNTTSTDAFNGSFVETLNWTINVTRGDLGLYAQGEYELALTAYDLRDTVSDEQTWAFTIDTSSPVITINDMFVDGNANRTPAYWLDAANRNNRNILQGTNPRIQGSVSDEFSALSKVQWQLRKYDYADGWKYYKFDGDLDYSNWEADAAAAVWDDLLGAGNKSPEIPLQLQLSGFADGYYCIQVRAKDSSVIGGNDDWVPASNGNPSGTNRYVYFFISRSPPELAHKGNDRFFSSVVNGGSIRLEGEAKGSNGFENIAIRVTPLNTGAAEFNVPTILPPSHSVVEWDWEASIPFNTVLHPDGAYRVTFTVTDMAGRAATSYRDITLDNTPPSPLLITEPRFVGEIRNSATNALLHEFAGETIYGGESAVIRGTTDDKGINGSASGVAEIWYHLGYIGSSYNGLPESLAFPTREQVAASVLGGAADTGGAANNARFDDAAKDLNTRWFKYANEPDPINPVYINPKEFTRPENVDLYSWELTLSANLKDYANMNYVPKTGAGAAVFNTYGGSWLALRIDDAKLPPSLAKSGLYSMPLWIRVSDQVGNVSYVCRDIWIYPNGDNPTTAIINPSAPASAMADARGGAISIDGVASDNRNVQNVIYRVWADNNANPTMPRNGDAVNIELKGANLVPTNAPEWGLLPVSPVSYRNGNWYFANLEAAPGSLTIPWSFMINAEDEIKSLIATRGLASPNSTGGNDMIRVLVEVFVFDGKDESSTVADHLISLGNSTDENAPEPNTRVFYIKDSAPEIRNPRISSLSAFNAAVASPASLADASFVAFYQGDIRSGRFALRAELAGNAPIGQISVRISGDTAWRTAYSTAGSAAAIPGLAISPANPAANDNKAVLTYSFDSGVSAAASGYSLVQNGNWQNEGGTFTVDVRIRDESTTGEASYTFTVGIDNYAPVADTVKNVTPSKVAGSDVDFIGRVFDYYGSPTAASITPQYRGVASVVAWFTKETPGGTQYINMNTGAMSAASGISMITRPVWVNRQANVAYDGNTDNIANIAVSAAGSVQQGQYPALNGWNKTISEAAATPESKMTWQPFGADNRDILWNFKTDTTLLPDGWVDLNYIVIDSAGNATLYKQSMVVMNRYPKITSITLYTNNVGEGAAFTTHQGDVAKSDYPVPSSPPEGYRYLNSGFISKNKVIGFGVNTISGNGPLHYRVQYVERVRVPLNAANLAAMANRNLGAALGGALGGGKYANLYTIDTVTDIDRFTWAILGVSASAPEPGVNFVFQPDAAGIAGLGATGKDGYEDDWVWAYREIFAREKLNHSSAANPNEPVVPDDDLSGNGFNFVGSNYFDGAGKIPQLLGSQPDEPDVPPAFIGKPEAVNGTYNNPDATAYFLIKVWDSVDNRVGPGDANYREEEMLYDSVVVGLNVFLSDHTNPTIRLYDLNPYTETAVVGNNIGEANQARTMAAAADPAAVGRNILRGGLYNTKTERELVRSGYIEPRHNTTALNPQVRDPYTGAWQARAADGLVSGDSISNMLNSIAQDYDKVSGKVILRGVAWDDQLIDTISITISPGAQALNNVDILKLTPVDANGSPVAENSPAFVTKKMMPPSGINAWVYEELHWKTGHTVEWAYVWDTEAIPSSQGTPAEVQISLSAKDKNGSVQGASGTPAGLASSAESRSDDPQAGIFHNQTRVNIVPYIYGFEREKPKFETKRSRQGWYSFYQGEQNISVLGYNFGANAGNVSVRLDTGSLASPANTLTPTLSGGQFRFNIPATAASGRINVRVGAVDAYNHSSNHVAKSWNRESHYYTSGSDLWTNKPFAHIWRSTHDNAAPRTFFGASAGTATGNNDDGLGLSRPAMALEYTGANAGRLVGVWAVYGKANVYSGYNGGASGTNRESGNPPTEPFVGPDISIYNGGTTGTLVYVHENDGSPLLTINNGIASGTSSSTVSPTASGPTRRYQNNRTLRSASNSHALTYDAVNRNLFYSRANSSNNNFRIDGAGSVAAANGGLAATTDAGLFSAIDYDSAGVVIAYYDAANDALRIAFGSQEAPNNANQWTRRYVLPEGHSLFRGSGRYVSMKVDKNSNIHLSFYNTTYNTLVYVKGARNGTGFRLDEAVTVDNVVRGGVWSDISVDNDGYPFIVYGDTSRIGNYDGMRVAYKSGQANGAFGRALNDPHTANSIRGWEALSVPANYTVNDDRLQIEAWPPTVRGGTLGASPGWNAAVGYGSDRFRIAYFYLPAAGVMAAFNASN